MSAERPQPATRTAGAPGAQGPGQTSDAGSETAIQLRSEKLMHGARSIEIVHNGEVYRLQATRLGKLILTK
jgi:hemin uptake protein HemP